MNEKFPGPARPNWENKLENTSVEFSVPRHFRLGLPVLPAATCCSFPRADSTTVAQLHHTVVGSSSKDLSLDFSRCSVLEGATAARDGWLPDGVHAACHLPPPLPLPLPANENIILLPSKNPWHGWECSFRHTFPAADRDI